MYVAITRARQRLYLTFSQTRLLHGQTRYNIRSRFFDELPEHTLKWLTPARSAFADAMPTRRDVWQDHTTPWGSPAPVVRKETANAGPNAWVRSGVQVFHTKFGEGTVLKRESYRYNIQPLRPSVVAGLPVETCHWLIDHSLGFNRFIMNQLNERLGQFIAAREIDRMNDPDVRVARSLASLFNPVLYPGVGEVLRITQQELAYLVGLSRQRVNMALNTLQEAALIRIEYGGLRVLSLEGLRNDAVLRTL